MFSRDTYFLTALLLAIFLTQVQADVQRKKFGDEAGTPYLVVEFLDDDLVHIEISAVGNGPPLTQPLYTSPMVYKRDYNGPNVFIEQGDTLETADMMLQVDPASFTVTVHDKTRNGALLTRITPAELDQSFKRLRIAQGEMQHIYGLGQQFKMLGSADGDWTSHGVREGGPYGNSFAGFQSAAVGNVQIPIMYAVGPGKLNYALFLDNVYRQRWDFNQTPWEARMFGDQLRFYLMTGPDLPDLRSDYLELTGRPPVPPRKALGLWVSEFGYDNWNQIESLRKGLRDKGFPVDGFVLDLNWFGGVNLIDPQKSRMGRINWDEDPQDGNSYFFPDPHDHVKQFAADHLGIAAIEESYVANTTDTFSQMPTQLSTFSRTNGVCDKANQNQAVVDVEGFWGVGRMVDWSDPAAGSWFHMNRRFPNLVKKGITVHWTDLGEPERFNCDACYEGVELTAGGVKNEHADIHNLYNLLWNKSIWDGYYATRGQTNGLDVINPRPFILTRSGAAGTQRFGAAMWSGDIASNLQSLATHGNAQLHMSFSGIDFYGSDCGGFRREVLPCNDDEGSYRGYEEEMYTQWFANSCWFDVPVRPHTDNEFKQVTPPYATSPHLVGKLDSNVANLRRRYSLVPYYYSLAYRAFLDGEPVIPPLVFYYQDDPQVRKIGHEKLVGRDLLVGIVARHGEYERDVYLPKGKWVDYYSNEWVTSNGQTIDNLPVYRSGLLCVPAFARAGAIIPRCYVDEHTKDVFGHRLSDAEPHDELLVRVYADAQPSRFVLYEDDGTTLAYDPDRRPRYQYRTTSLTQQQLDANTVQVTIGLANNVNSNEPFPGAINVRANVVELVVENAQAIAVELNETPLVKRNGTDDFAAAESGWYNADQHLILAKSPQVGVYEGEQKFVFHLTAAHPLCSANFVCDRGFTDPGQGIYVVGSIPELGEWDVNKAVRLSPSVYYEYIWNPPAGHHGPGPSAPVWTGIMTGLPAGTTFEWKCFRKRDDGTGSVDWEPGPNNRLTTPESGGYAGHSYGTF